MFYPLISSKLTGFIIYNHFKLDVFLKIIIAQYCAIEINTYLC